MGTFFYKEGACGCFSWISKCLGIKQGDINIVPETQNKEEEEPAIRNLETQNKEEEEPAIRNLEMLKSRAPFSFLGGLSLEKINELLHKSPHVFDDNKKKLWIDQESLKLWISAKALNIELGNDQRYWKWIRDNKSSFGEVARLETAQLFQVKAKIDCGLLSPATKYKVSFRMKFEGLSGWEGSPTMISLSTSWGSGFKYESARYFSDLYKPVGIKWVADATYRYEEDGWVELDAGCFELPEGEDVGKSSNEEVEVTMKQVDAVGKRGVVIDCVKVVPLKLQH